MARVAIACGGTGGHLYPGLAVAEELRAAGHEVRIYTSSKEIDRTVMEGFPEFESTALPAVGWTGMAGAPRFVSSFIKAYRQCSRDFRQWGAQAVLGMGGFTCLPILVAARMRGIPSFLHESNAIPGKATRWLSPWTDKVLLGFGECAMYLDNTDVGVTGTPVRRSLRKLDRAEAAMHWDLDPRRFTIAVMGGSQGARGLNEAVARAAAEWRDLADRIQVIHLTGKGQAELMAANYLRAGIPSVVREFCHEMEYVYNLADVVIARSGAASLTEIGHFGLPSILVPYPHAAEKHQHRNADVFSGHGAAFVVEEGESAGTAIAARVRDFYGNEALRRRMAEAATVLRGENPAKRVAMEVEHVLA